MKATLSLQEFINFLNKIKTEYPSDANLTVHLGKNGMTIHSDKYFPGKWEKDSRVLAKAKPIPGGLGFYIYQERKSCD